MIDDIIIVGMSMISMPIADDDVDNVPMQVPMIIMFVMLVRCCSAGQVWHKRGHIQAAD